MSDFAASSSGHQVEAAGRARAICRRGDRAVIARAFELIARQRKLPLTVPLAKSLSTRNAKAATPPLQADVVASDFRDRPSAGRWLVRPKFPEVPEHA